MLESNKWSMKHKIINLLLSTAVEPSEPKSKTKELLT